MTTITEANFDEVINSKPTSIVKLGATWCGPCRNQEPILEQLNSEIGDTTAIGSVDVDNDPDLARRFGVRSVPTLLIFKNGELIEKLVGLQTAAKLQESIAG